MHSVTQKQLNWSVKCTLEYIQNFFLTECTKIVQNDSYVQYTTYNAVIPLYKLSGLNLNIPINMRQCWLWGTVFITKLNQQKG
jgi:hypothetical protein